MRMLDEIKLRAVTRTSGANGFPVETVAETSVYADVESVGQSEYYAAQSIKRRADIVFVVKEDEYSGQTEVQYGSTIYDVVRTAQKYEARTNTRLYRADPSKIRLICSRR